MPEIAVNYKMSNTRDIYKILEKYAIHPQSLQTLLDDSKRKGLEGRIVFADAKVFLDSTGIHYFQAGVPKVLDYNEASRDSLRQISNILSQKYSPSDVSAIMANQIRAMETAIKAYL